MAPQTRLSRWEQCSMCGGHASCCRAAARQEESSDSPPGSVTLQQRGQPNRTPPTPDVRLYHRAVVLLRYSRPYQPGTRLAIAI